MLSPLQPLTSTPYAVQSLNATTAQNAVQLGGVAADQYVVTSDARLTDARPPTAGSADYIQNNPASQQAGSFSIGGNGTTGSMNVNGAVSLGGTSPPITAPAGQGRIYFDASSNKVKVSENGAAFVNLVGASGVSGSGTTNTIPVWSGGTTLANSGIRQSAEGVQLPNGVQLDVGAQGNQVRFGSPSGETGMSIQGASGRADLRFDGLLKLVAGPAGQVPPATNGIAITTQGLVGIGTTTPQSKLVVNAGGSGGEMRFGTPGGESGLAIIGTNRADVRFDGTTLKLLAGTGSGAMAPTNGIAITTAGNVGIGTSSPANKLSVNGGADFSDTVRIGIAVDVTPANLVVRYTGTNGIAVYGESHANNGFGVIGSADTGTHPVGVYGATRFGSLTRAGFFAGNVEVTGTLIQPAGSFKIDHPLDPANKYLYHSFVESPDMKNIYDGNVTTDASGEAEVTLPDWFEALNKDFRYQLTVIGQFAQAIVAAKIKENRFKIKTSLPNVEVSWQVTGIRQDAYADQHRIPVEELKDERERGSYLHPEDFGQPEEQGVQWRLHPEMMKRMKEEREGRQREQNNKAAAPAARP